METKQRQIAYKVRISEILKGEYIKEEGWAPNYVMIRGDRVSRINIIGIIIAKTDNNENGEVLIDDKTGKISVITFNNSSIFEDVNIGNVVLLVGRPREYNNGKYIVPEIIRKVNKSWFELRLVELGQDKRIINQKDNTGVVEEVKRGAVIDQIIKSKINSDDVIGLIKRLDVGDGADYEKIVETLGNEKIIKDLLEEGEIFEIAPGRLKAL